MRDQAIAEHPTEADAAAQWCADGGRVVLAGANAVAAPEAAAQPVFDRLAQDPTTGEAITAIEALKVATTPAPGAVACEPAPTASATARPLGTPATLPPAGTWRVEFSPEELPAAGLSAGSAGAWAGTHTWAFDGPTGGYEHELNGKLAEACTATLEPTGDLVRFVYSHGDACEGEVDSIQWRLDGDASLLTLIDIEAAPHAENKAYLETKPWTKIE